MPVPKPANDAKLIVLNPGLRIITTPTKPTTTAIHRRRPTFSFKIIADNNVTKIGYIKARVRLSVKEMIEIE